MGQPVALVHSCIVGVNNRLYHGTTSVVPEGDVTPPAALEAAEKRYSGSRKGGASAPPRRRGRKLLKVLGRALRRG